MSNTASYPCDRGIQGNVLARGYHNYVVGPSGVCCTYCGSTPTAERARVDMQTFDPILSTSDGHDKTLARSGVVLVGRVDVGPQVISPRNPDYAPRPANLFLEYRADFPDDLIDEDTFYALLRHHETFDSVHEAWDTPEGTDADRG